MKDKRYKIVKSLITTNELAKFADIFSVIPISVLAKDTGFNYSTLHKKIHNTRLLNLNDLTTIANLFECDVVDLFKLAVKSIPKSAKG